MKYNPLEARTLFIDGPVAVYISTASREDIEEAYARIAAYVKVAAEELGREHSKEVLQIVSSGTPGTWVPYKPGDLNDPARPLR